MAEMNLSNSVGHKNNAGVRIDKKRSTRIDLTPMVDLGFLLITFFMFTTALSKPKAMELNMPYPDPELPNEVTNTAAMTILLSKDHRVYYYKGIGHDPAKPPRLIATGFQPKGGIRDAIIEKKADVARAQGQGIIGPKNHATFLIKPDDNSTYADLVNILDEMAINDARVYAVVDITALDKELIAKTGNAIPTE